MKVSRERAYRGIRLALAIETEQMTESSALQLVEEITDLVNQHMRVNDVPEVGYAVQTIQPGDEYLVGEDVQRGGWYGNGAEKPGRKGNFKTTEDPTVAANDFTEGDVI